jgi:hypothetical protein
MTWMPWTHANANDFENVFNQALPDTQMTDLKAAIRKLKNNNVSNASNVR